MRLVYLAVGDVDRLEQKVVLVVMEDLGVLVKLELKEMLAGLAGRDRKEHRLLFTECVISGHR